MLEKTYAVDMNAGQALVDTNLKFAQNPTIRQNLDNRIAMHKAAIVRLEATRTKMEASNLLDVPIGDLREVMNY